MRWPHDESTPLHFRSVLMLDDERKKGRCRWLARGFVTVWPKKRSSKIIMPGGGISNFYMFIERLVLEKSFVECGEQGRTRGQAKSLEDAQSGVKEECWTWQRYQRDSMWGHLKTSSKCQCFFRYSSSQHFKSAFVNESNDTQTSHEGHAKSAMKEWLRSIVRFKLSCLIVVFPCVQ